MCLASVPAFAQDLDHSLDAVHKSQELRKKADYREAERVLREAIAKPELGPRSHMIALNNLADLLREQDRRAEARVYFEEALQCPNPGWDQEFAAKLGLADVDRQEERWEESVSLLTSAADLARANNSPIMVAFAETSLGETYLDAGNLSRAEPLARRALFVLENDPQVPRERVAVALDNMASVYRLENKTALAEETWLRELDIHRAIFGDYHPQTAMVMGRLAEVWSLAGDFNKAESWSRQSVDVMKSLFGEKSLPAGSAIVNAALIEERANHLNAAADMYSNALNIFRDGTANPASVKVVGELYARVLSEMHKGKEAKQVMAQIQAFHSK